MAKVHGLFRADGQPVRQYGEHIKEPGEEFNGATRDTIRSLIVEHGGDLDPEEPIVPEEGPPPATKSSDMSTDDSVSHVAPSRMDVAEDDPLLRQVQNIWKDTPEVADELPNAVMAEKEVPPPIASRSESWRKVHIVEGRLGRAVWAIWRRPRGLALVVLIGIVLWRPWLVMGPVAVLFGLLLFLCVLLGIDRIGASVAWVYRQYHARAPDRADRLRQTASQWITDFGWLSGRLPESWVWGLYQPEHVQQAQAAQDAVVRDRFARMAAEGQSTANR